MQPNPWASIRTEVVKEGHTLDLQYRKPDNYNGRDWTHGWAVIHMSPTDNHQIGPIIDRIDDVLPAFFAAYDEIKADGTCNGPYDCKTWKLKKAALASC